MITIDTKQYKKDSSTASSVTYNGPANTLSNKDTLDLSRVMPKKGGGTDGVGRPIAVFRRTTVTNSETGAKGINLLRLEGSLAVGTAAADIDELLDDAIAYLGTAEGRAHFKALTIEH